MVSVWFSAGISEHLENETKCVRCHRGERTASASRFDGLLCIEHSLFSFCVDVRGSLSISVYCEMKKVPSKWKSMKIIFYVLIPQRLFIFVINNRDSFILLFPYVLFVSFFSACQYSFSVHSKGFSVSISVSFSFSLTLSLALSLCLSLFLFLVMCALAKLCATILLRQKPKWHRKYLMERQIEIKIEIKPLDKMNWKFQRLKIWSLCFLMTIYCLFHVSGDFGSETSLLAAKLRKYPLRRYE